MEYRRAKRHAKLIVYKARLWWIELVDAVWDTMLNEDQNETSLTQ